MSKTISTRRRFIKKFWEVSPGGWRCAFPENFMPINQHLLQTTIHRLPPKATGKPGIFEAITKKPGFKFSPRYQETR